MEKEIKARHVFEFDPECSRGEGLRFKTDIYQFADDDYECVSHDLIMYDTFGNNSTLHLNGIPTSAITPKKLRQLADELEEFIKSHSKCVYNALDD
jgi:hypothetical protein